MFRRVVVELQVDSVRHSEFVIVSSFGLRHSSLARTQATATRRRIHKDS